MTPKKYNKMMSKVGFLFFSFVITCMAGASNPDNYSLQLPAGHSIKHSNHEKLKLNSVYPIEKENGVSVKTPILVHFNNPLNIKNIDLNQVALFDNNGKVKFEIKYVDDNKSLQIKPIEELTPLTEYSLLLKDVKDIYGQTITVSSSFTTLSLGKNKNLNNFASNLDGQLNNLPAHDSFSGYDWMPGQNNLNGHWRLYKTKKYQNENLVLYVKNRSNGDKKNNKNYKNFSTGLVGQVLAVNDEPLTGVKVKINAPISSAWVTTDEHGVFVINSHYNGSVSLEINGQSIKDPSGSFGSVIVGANLTKNKINQLGYQIYLPHVDKTDTTDVSLPVNQDITLTNNKIPGLKIVIPKRTLIKDSSGKNIQHLALVPMPVDRSPYPDPGEFPVYFSLQPGNVTFSNPKNPSEGLAIFYPDYLKQYKQESNIVDTTGNKKEKTNNSLIEKFANKPKHIFWSYNPLFGWKEYGNMQKDPITGNFIQAKFYNATGMSYSIQDNKPANATTPGCASCQKNGGAGEPPPSNADPVDLGTGTFYHNWTDFSINDTIPINFVRTTNSRDGVTPYFSLIDYLDYVPNRDFGVGNTDNYSMYLEAGTYNGCSVTYLVMPDGEQIDFSPNTPTTNSACQGTWTHYSTHTVFFGSTLISGNTTLGNGGEANCYIITLTNGTKLYFYNEINHNLLRAIADPRGNTLIIVRNGSQIERVMSPNGYFLNFTYNTNNFVSSISDPIGRTVNYIYDSSGVLLDQVNYPDGTNEQYTYNSNAQMTTIQDRRGNIRITNIYDFDIGNGAITSQTNADGGEFTFNYSLGTYATDLHTSGVYTNITAIVPAFTGTSQSYTEYGGVTTSSIVAPFTPYNPLLLYYPMTHVKTTFPSGLTEDEDFGHFPFYGYATTLKINQGLSSEKDFTYTRETGAGFLTNVSDGYGRSVAYSYDTNGNITGVVQTGTDASTRIMSMSYGIYQNPTSFTDPLSHTTSIGYDGVGNLTSITDPLSHFVSASYNGKGQVSSVTNPVSETFSSTYIGANVSSLSNSSGDTQRYQYDAVGRVISTSDPMGFRSLISYDSMDRVVSTTDPMNATTTYSYDNNGNLLSITDPNGHSISWAYDNMDRVTSRTDQLSHSESWTYNTSSQVTSYTDRNGHTTSISYDALQRTHVITFSDSSTLTYHYEHNGNLHSIVDSLNGTLSYTHDGFDEVTSETTPTNYIAYTYDGKGRPYTTQLTGQGQITYAFDNADRLSSITEGSQSVGFTYDNMGRRTKVTYPTGTTSNYSYDIRDNLESIIYEKSNSSIFDSMYFDHDSDGRIVQITGSLAPQNLDDTLSASYNNKNQLDSFTQSGTTNTGYTYDNNGNMTSDGTYTYVWDARGELSEIKNASNVVVSSFSYDAMGRRTYKSVPADSYNFTYDGDNIIQEVLASGSTHNYLNGLGTDERYGVNNIDPSNNSTYFYLLGDQVNSTSDIVDSSENIAQTNTYTPYGQTTSTTNPTSISGYIFPLSNSLTYTGREDDGNGLMYYRNRYYSPTMKRFISEDPIGLSGGINQYAYVNGNPLSFSDPDGKDPVFGGIILLHYGRNIFNKNEQFDDLGPDKWEKLKNDESIYHQQGGGDNIYNTKYVSPDGHDEAVYDINNNPVTDSLNGASYNYAGPHFAHGIPHALLDVIPYYIWGNTPDDMWNTTRFKTTWDMVIMPKYNTLFNNGSGICY